MLAGRAFQGVGSGVILSLVEIVLADLIPLSERYVYLCQSTVIHLRGVFIPTEAHIKGHSVQSGPLPLQQVRASPSEPGGRGTQDELQVLQSVALSPLAIIGGYSI